MRHFSTTLILGAAASLFIPPAIANATSLSIGADYFLRGVAIEERHKTFTDNDYYDQRLQAYLITDLSQDVEATVRVQSITPWGLENSTSALSTRYPDANGDLWVQNAFIRMPNIWKERIILTVGRQPLLWGDGAILSDDELGFNAIRAQIQSPWRRLPFDLDIFTAKIDEGLQTQKDTDLNGAIIGFDRKGVRWEIMGLFETDENSQNYEMGADTSPVVATKIERKIFGVRAKVNLKDAFSRGEYYFQEGDIRRPSSTDITLEGDAFVIGLGGKANTKKIGRFGAILEVATGSGDQAGTINTDEAFRPTFASRWNGLERRGYGNYFASTLSDVYSSTSPFAPATSVNDGLPPGTSGIQTIHFGVDSTPWAKWTLTFDYYQYKAQRNLSGGKELGVEFDYGLIYRYSGLVTAKASTSNFTPGDAYDDATKQDASFSSIELSIKF